MKKPQQRTTTPFQGGDSSAPRVGQPPLNLRRALQEFEKQFIIDILKQNQGHRGHTAALLDIDRKTLYTKLKKYGVI